MTAYFIRRFLLMIPTFIGITLLSFVIMHIVPGGPIEQAIQDIRMGGHSAESGSSATDFMSSTLTSDAIEQMRKDYGFDKPLLLRYAQWLWKIVQLDFGTSYLYGDPVWDVIKSRLPISIYFGSIGFILTYLVCIPLGIMKAVKHKHWLDTLTSILVFIGYATPGFALGIVLLVLFGGGSFWDVFPLGGFVSDEFPDLTLWGKAWDLVRHTFLPGICYMISSFATLTILMKNSLLENLNQEYIVTAFAKGLPGKIVVYKHALRNSLIPLATGFGHFISIILAGSFLIEKVFNIDGMGLLAYTAIIDRDYPVALGILVISSFLGLLGNILSDMCYVLIDPRIEFR
ncbi:peptide ABC transporter permease [candidate division KSB3 bacterium]|uniref:Peptide ABC transporter permease n=1 Tax=candidate division KSB3 bacterium TaxID=2044937 RepID=A0A2G6E5K1_9BACT|nr:MAG: peptide ABC transporter permease [candidate division KSB3 bacterium]PIE29862.1 MAG: peptide ABC transporter permease [candidate division KSB3 bacterium]